jgi:hypothetical protein
MTSRERTTTMSEKTRRALTPPFPSRDGAAHQCLTLARRQVDPNPPGEQLTSKPFRRLVICVILTVPLALADQLDFAVGVV